MKLKDFDDVKALIVNYRRVKDHVKIVRDGNALGVTIQGAYQDEEMLKEMRPIVAECLERRLRVLETQLIELGVYDFEENGYE